VSEGLIWREHYATEEEARTGLVAEARSWLGTPWAHAHDLKGIAVDCAMLLVRVHVDRRIIAPFDPRPYPSQWFLHHEAARFISVVERFGRRVSWPKPGDVAMYKFGKHAAHGAIVVDQHHMIHASRPSRAVILDSRGSMIDRFSGYWSLFE
jgi:cell wall-associated NlpC family hydrolase